MLTVLSLCVLAICAQQRTPRSQPRVSQRARRDVTQACQASLVASQTEPPTPKHCTSPSAGACDVKFSIFYVNCSAPSGAHHPSLPQGHTTHVGKSETCTPEQQQSAFTMLSAATPKGVSSPDCAARTRPDLWFGERGVEDCTIWTFEYLTSLNSNNESLFALALLRASPTWRNACRGATLEVGRLLPL